MTLRAPAPFDPARHDVERFDSGRPRLDTWLRAYAGQNQRRDAARTYVLADAAGEVVGYYTLVAAQLDHADATPDVRRGLSRRFPIPVVLLARLAIAGRCQGQGLGAELLADALRRSVRAAQEVGIRAVVVDALDTDAAGFYRRFGPQPATDDGLTLMATVAQLRRAGARCRAGRPLSSLVALTVLPKVSLKELNGLSSLDGAMLILSPEERAQVWHDAVSAEAADREYKRHVLASVAFQIVGSELSLYSDDYATAFRDSFDLLERSGLIGRDELREPFEEIDEQVGTARAFVAALGRQLRATAAMQRLSGNERGRAEHLAERWREAAAEDISGVEDDGEVYVSVAEAAAAYDVTPQAVYKWIHKGVIEAHTRPGGSYRIPVAALAADERLDVGRARRLQQTLARRQRVQERVSAEEMLGQIRRRRTASR